MQTNQLKFKPENSLNQFRFEEHYNSQNISKTKSIQLGDSHTALLKYNGKIQFFGNNTKGQCDIQIDNYIKIKDVKLGVQITGLLYENNIIKLNGDNSFEQLDLPDTENKNISKFALCSSHSIILRNDNSFYCFGENTHGQCDISVQNNINISIIKVEVGQDFTLVLQENGRVKIQGFYDNDVDLLSVINLNIVTIAAGYAHAILLYFDKTSAGIGQNVQRQCELSQQMNRNIMRVAAGGGHSAYLQTDGTLHLTGYNDDKQCDVEEGQNKNVRQVDLGGDQTGFIHDDEVVLIGDNTQGQCDIDLEISESDLE